MLIRKAAAINEVARLDDDMLKFRHDGMSRDNAQSRVLFYILIALGIAFLIFKR
jgi:hypothetical protein